MAEPTSRRTTDNRADTGASDDLSRDVSHQLENAGSPWATQTEERPPEREPQAAGTKPQGVAAQIREKAATQISTQKDRLTETLSSTVEAVRHTSEQLRRQDHAAVADYVERGVDQVEEWIDRVRQRDVRDMVRDLQEFGRRQPALLLAGSFAVGVVAARFLKSSARSAESSEFDSPLQFAEGDEPWSRG